MARVNVYLPDDLAAEVRAADLDVSAVAQAALRDALGARQMDAWLDDVGRLRPVEVPRAAVREALAGVRDEFEEI